MNNDTAASKVNAGKVFCFHCNSYVSRMTAYRHARKTSAPEVNQLNRHELNDHRRQNRCEQSSDEENGAATRHTRTINYENDSSQSSESDQADESLDSADSVVWEESVMEEMVRDVTDHQPILPHQATTGVATARRFVFWILYSICLMQCCHILSNKCIEHLLMLFHQVFVYLGNHYSVCSTIAGLFPVSIYLMRKYLGFERDNFTKYVVCSNCYALYRYDEVVYTAVNGQTVAKLCSNKVYSCKSVSHRNTRVKGKLPCGSPLVRQVKDCSGKTLFYPIKVYCYKGVINTIEQLVQKPNFDSLCQKWKSRNEQDEIFADVFDGAIWKRFQVDTDSQDSFDLRKPHNYGLMVNVDWFQPFERRRDVSIGVIYMVVMNLPRELRFKPENVLLVGIIPALSKEPETLNSFLRPIVEELRHAWRGVSVNSSVSGESIFIKAALLCAAADIPAARKLCGFLGHSATQGCSHCTVRFVDCANVRSCAGFDVTSWTARNRTEHLKYAKKAQSAETLTIKNCIEKQSGYRYTALLDLEYFEPSVFLAIDPMHNLFLGTAKRLLSHWIDQDILTKRNLVTISERVECLNVCSDVGRIPSNICSNYGQFTAQEWKNWVLIYSMYALNEVLPIQHMRVWQTFVLACKYLCKTCISETDLNLSHNLLIKFCKEAEKLYGSKFITPNMHLHCHLRESVSNYGSVYGFWLFSFERYNDLLGDFPTNNRSIEVQLMRKFEMVTFVGNIKYKNVGEFQTNLDFFAGNENLPSSPNEVNIVSAATDLIQNVSSTIWSDLSNVKYKLTNFQLFLLPLELRSFLHQMCVTLYGDLVLQSNISTICKKIKSVSIGNHLYGASGCIVYGKWADHATQISNNADIRPAKVNYYILHTIELNDGRILDHILAVVEWFKPSQSTLGYLKPAFVCDKKCQNDGPFTFLPIQRIIGRCGYAYESRNKANYVVTCPIPNHTFM